MPDSFGRVGRTKAPKDNGVSGNAKGTGLASALPGFPGTTGDGASGQLRAYTSVLTYFRPESTMSVTTVAPGPRRRAT